MTDFDGDRRSRIAKMRSQPDFEARAESYLLAIGGRMDYAFDWMGVPIIQLPEDVLALQECVYRSRADVVIETGVARGGSMLLYATLLSALHPDRDFRVVGVDIDVREHTRGAIAACPFQDRIHLVESPSTDAGILGKLREFVRPSSRVMVVLDSDHTFSHVRDEIEIYKELVSVDSFLVVMDTGIEYRPADYYQDRDWGPGNSPMTAVNRLLETDPRFVADEQINSKIAVTASPGGYLRRIQE